GSSAPGPAWARPLVERALMKPGETSAPAASITCAPAGTATFAPTDSIRSPRITIVPRSIGGREIEKILALVIATMRGGPARPRSCHDAPVPDPPPESLVRLKPAATE